MKALLECAWFGSALRAVVIITLGAGAGVFVNAVRGTPLRIAEFEAPAACSTAHGGPAVLAEIGPSEAALYCGKPGTIFADARTAEAFAAGHVAEAVHLPCNASGAAPHALDGARRIIVYADSTEGARPVADGLQRRFEKAEIQVLRGGFSEWEAHGLQCAAGPCPDCRATHP